jgi:hypothetical protein
MTNSILMPVHLNDAAGLTKDVELQKFLGERRNQIWIPTDNDDFDKILKQRIYEPTRNTIKHFEDGCYESSIVMCGAIAEMLTYFLFFVHTNSIEIISNDCDVSDSRFDHIKAEIVLYKEKNRRDKRDEDEILKKEFGKDGDQTKRINILSESKINKEDYSKNGEGHDIKKICYILRKIHQIRIQYFHRWFYEDEERVKNEARGCIKFLYEAIGLIFECDSSKDLGVLVVNASITNWITHLFKNN